MDKFELIAQDLKDRDLELPESKHSKTFVTKVANTFLNPSFKGTMEDAIEEQLQEVYYSYCDDWVEEHIEEMDNMEYASWEAGDYDYMLNEGNVTLDYIFTIDTELDDDSRSQPRQPAYTHDELEALGIDIMDYSYCKVLHTFWQSEQLGDDPFLYSWGSLGESSYQLCRDDHYTEDFYKWYDLMDNEHQHNLNNSFGYTVDFDLDCSMLYSDNTQDHADYFVNYASIYEAIVDAEQDNEDD